jgi:hypothetical protein
VRDDPSFFVFSAGPSDLPAGAARSRPRPPRLLEATDTDIEASHTELSPTRLEQACSLVEDMLLQLSSVFVRMEPGSRFTLTSQIRCCVLLVDEQFRTLTWFIRIGDIVTHYYITVKEHSRFVL